MTAATGGKVNEGLSELAPARLIGVPEVLCDQVYVKSPAVNCAELSTLPSNAQTIPGRKVCEVPAMATGCTGVGGGGGGGETGTPTGHAGAAGAGKSGEFVSRHAWIGGSVTYPAKGRVVRRYSLNYQDPAHRLDE